MKVKKIARFGHVWKDRKTGKIHGTSIDVKTHDELLEYEQVPAPQEKPQKELFETDKPFYNTSKKGGVLNG